MTAPEPTPTTWAPCPRCWGQGYVLYPATDRRSRDGRRRDLEPRVCGTCLGVGSVTDPPLEDAA